jgi:DNA repair exonuclease SbcCD nuclease subunit
VVVHGQSYGRTDVTEDLSANFPKAIPDLFNVGLLHTSADGRASEHKPYAPCSLRTLIDKGYHYWALGHVHRRTELSLDPPVLFPGNLQGRHVREAGPKGATLVSVDDDLRARPEHRDLDVVRWHLCEISVTDTDTPDAVIDHAAEKLLNLRRADLERPLAVRVRITGQCGAHQKLVEREEHWASELRGRAASIDALWVEKVLFETRTPIDLVALRRQPGALATLLHCLDECGADAVALRALADGLAPLRKALGTIDEVPLFEDPEELRALLAEVEQLVVPMLLDGGRPR